MTTIIFSESINNTTITDFNSNEDTLTLPNSAQQTRIFDDGFNTTLQFPSGSLVLSGIVMQTLITSGSLLFSDGSTVILGGNADDSLNADSITNDRILAKDGNDTVTGGDGNEYLQGNSGNDHIIGNGGNDILHGGMHNDTLNGGLGNDELHGDLGNNTLTGGLGNDRYIIASDPGSTTTITDSTVGNDRVDISNIAIVNSFNDLTISSVPGGTKVSMANGQSILFTDRTPGSITPELFEFSRPEESVIPIVDTNNPLPPPAPLRDFSPRDDILNGNIGNNNFNLNDVNDFQPTDFLHGGAGLDTLNIKNGGVVDLNVIPNGNFLGIEFIQTIGLFDYQVTLRDDVISEFIGGAGNDIVRPSDLIETIDGGGGRNRLDFSQSAENITFNLKTNSWNGGNAEGDTYSNFTDLTGSMGNDSITPSATAERLDGSDGTDIVDYSSSATVTVNLDTESGLGTDAANDTLIGFEHVRGSLTAANSLTGNDGNNSLIGGDANDNIFGLNGSDTLIGGNSADFLFGGNGSDLIIGGNGSDGLSGNLGNNTFIGGLGGDIITLDNDDDQIRYETTNDGALPGSELNADFIALFNTVEDNDVIAFGGEYNDSSNSAFLDNDGDGILDADNGGSITFDADTEIFFDTNIYANGVFNDPAFLAPLLITSASNGNGILVVRGPDLSAVTAQSAIYYYEENGIEINDITADELSLLATITHPNLLILPDDAFILD